jgi:TonB family protein
MSTPLRHHRVLSVVALLSLFWSVPAASAQFSKLDDLGNLIAKKLKSAKPHAVAVADFIAPDGTSLGQGRYFASLLSVSIARHAKHVPVIQHDSFDHFLASDNFAAADLLTPLALGALHTQLGLDFLVTGVLEIDPDNYRVTIVIHDVPDSSELLSSTIVMARSALTDTLSEPFPPRTDYPIIRFSLQQMSQQLEHQPRCIHCPDPPYPDAARANHLQGECAFEILVSPEGKVVQVHPVKTLGNELDGLAAETIKSWILKPATDSKGHPVGAVVPVKVTFREF